MQIAQAFLAEFEHEAGITRRFLERLPEDNLTWKPHEKSMTAGQLAFHLATVPGGVVQMASTNPAPPPKFGNPQPGSVKEVLEAHDAGVATVKKVLPAFDDAAMAETWRLEKDGEELMAMPRAAFLRAIMLSHWIQHRGQFGVYLRLLDVAVPSSYGPSADEMPEFVKKAMGAG